MKIEVDTKELGCPGRMKEKRMSKRFFEIYRTWSPDYGDAHDENVAAYIVKELTMVPAESAAGAIQFVLRNGWGPFIIRHGLEEEKYLGVFRLDEDGSIFKVLDDGTEERQEDTEGEPRCGPNLEPWRLTYEDATARGKREKREERRG